MTLMDVFTLNGILTLFLTLVTLPMWLSGRDSEWVLEHASV